MKKTHQLIITLLVCAAVMTACTKTGDTADEAVRQGEATIGRIMDFKHKMVYYQAYPDVKDGESVTLDEAIWNIEALFNLTYSYPELSYGHTVIADTVIFLPVQADNSVLLTDLTVFYGQMFDVVRTIYQGIDLDNKQFLILDVEAGERHGNLQTIALHSVQGSVKGIQPPIPDPQMWEPFEEGPDWYYGENRGRRDGSFLWVMDAADTLSGMLNATLVPQAPNGFTYFYTETIMKELRNQQHDEYTNNAYPNCGPYSEFYCENPTENDKWMNTELMNFHYFGERHLVNSVLPDYGDIMVPLSHRLFNVTIIDELSQTFIRHHTQAMYGHRDVVGESIIIKGNL